MTPDIELSAGPATGTLFGSAVSQTFHPTAAVAFGVTLTFSSDAVGSVALARTTDQGSTWATRKAGPNDLTTFPVQAGTTKKVNVIDFDGGIYRFQPSLTAGSVSFSAGNGWLNGTGLALIGDLPNRSKKVDSGLTSSDYSAIAFPASATPAQFASFLATAWTPLATADISGDLIGYKFLASVKVTDAANPYYNTTNLQFAKVSIPAAAQRCKVKNFTQGADRHLRAEYVDVLSVLDWKGNAVASGKSWYVPAISYVPGQRLTAADYPVDTTKPSSGAFTDATYNAGIYFYPTLIEAVSAATWQDIQRSIDCTALGL